MLYINKYIYTCIYTYNTYSFIYIVVILLYIFIYSIAIRPWIHLTRNAHNITNITNNLLIKDSGVEVEMCFNTMYIERCFTPWETLMSLEFEF